MKFFITPDAQRDLDRLYAFLLPVNPDAAARAINLILERIRGLDQFPDHGRPAPDRKRELIVPFGAGEYIVRYEHDSGRSEIKVFRIWHSRENRG